MEDARSRLRAKEKIEAAAAKRRTGEKVLPAGFP